jgi:hypothetical protein
MASRTTLEVGLAAAATALAWGLGLLLTEPRSPRAEPGLAATIAGADAPPPVPPGGGLDRSPPDDGPPGEDWFDDRIVARGPHRGTPDCARGFHRWAMAPLRCDAGCRAVLGLAERCRACGAWRACELPGACGNCDGGWRPRGCGPKPDGHTCRFRVPGGGACIDCGAEWAGVSICQFCGALWAVARHCGCTFNTDAAAPSRPSFRRDWLKRVRPLRTPTAGAEPVPSSIR